MYCAFHFATPADAFTDSRSSSFQYSGQTGLPFGRIAGNSITSH